MQQVTFETVERAAAFVAELVRQGVTFKARETEQGTIVITLGGGY
jgi:hypothetical protein